MEQEGKRRSVKLTALVPPEVADAYRHAAATTGKSMAQVIREALEDHAAATRAEAEISSLLDAGKALAAVGVYLQLAYDMMDETVRATIEAVNEAILAIAGADLPDIEVAGGWPSEPGGPPPSEQRVPRRPYPSVGSDAAEAVPPAAEAPLANAVSPGSVAWLPDARGEGGKDVP